MRREIILLILFMGLNYIVSGQEDIPVQTLPTEIFRTVKKDPNDTTTWKWKRGGLFNLNLAQGSLSNWAAGGDNFSLTVNSYFNYFCFFKKGKQTWDNNLDVYFGYLQTTSLGGQKNDDRFDFLSKYGFRLDTSNKIFLSGLYNFRTQFFNGFTYFSRDSSILSSAFFSPAYMLLSAGFDYKPFNNFSLFMSPLTDRWTIMASNRLYDKGLYGVPAYHHLITQVGAFASMSYFQNLMKNIAYKGRMDLFTDYQNNPQNVDMFLTNLFSFKINRYLSATYNLDMIYDDNVKLFGPNHDSPGLQLKSLFGIGMMVPFRQIAHTD